MPGIKDVNLVMTVEEALSVKKALSHCLNRHGKLFELFEFKKLTDIFFALSDMKLEEQHKINQGLERSKNEFILY
jgi:hypothetical protein